MNQESQTITCGLCFKTLAKPLTFPCRHSFCSDCVRKQLLQNHNSGFLCPVCATPHPEAKADNLNQYADKNLDAYIKGLSDGKYGQPLCQWCEEAAATLQCGECMCTYCDGCCEAAHKRPTKRNHVVSKINDSCRSFYHRCHQYAHEEYRAEFYCEECDEVCCAYCLQVGPHKDHRNTNVAKAAAEARQQMAKDVQRLAQSKSLLETQTTELNRVTSTYNESYDHVEAQISERFTAFRQQLAQRELEARRALSQLRESGDAALTTARQQYLSQLNKVNEALLRFRSLQAVGADYEVLRSRRLLDDCVHAELPTMTGTGFALTNAGELALSGMNVQLDLQSADLMRAIAAEEYASHRTGARDVVGHPTALRTGPAAGEVARSVSDQMSAMDPLSQPLRLTFPVDEDVEATVRPDGVFLRCIARGGGGVQIGVRSKEMLESIIRMHPEDGGVVSWQVRLESVSDTFLGVVEKTSRGVVPEGFYWKPACAGIVDGHLGRQTSLTARMPVCRSGDVVRLIYDMNAMTLRIVINDHKDCGVVLKDLHPKIAACFIFYPGESLTVLF